MAKRKDQNNQPEDGYPIRAENVEDISHTCQCPVEGCGRALDLQPSVERPGRIVARCNCEMSYGRPVVEMDAAITHDEIETIPAPSGSQENEALSDGGQA